MMLTRVNKDSLHWQWSLGHFGFMRRGGCWRFFQWPQRTAYRSGRLIWWTWWRFFIAFERMEADE